MAAAVQRIVAVFVVQNAREADLPLVAMAAQLRVQTQTAALQVLKQNVSDHITALPAEHEQIPGLTTSGSVRGRGRQGNVSRRKVVISNSS